MGHEQGEGLSFGQWTQCKPVVARVLGIIAPQLLKEEKGLSLRRWWVRDLGEGSEPRNPCYVPLRLSEQNFSCLFYPVY